jgi:TonB family protein
LEKSLLTIAIVLALLLAPASQESGQAVSDDSTVPCHWSEEYRVWLSHWQESSDSRTKIAEPVKPPKKLRDKSPQYPKDSRGRQRRGGRPVVEAVIDGDGKVLEARLIQRIEWEPAWPEFDEAILAAVRKWEFEPLNVGGLPLWVCMTVGIGIEWQ